MTSLFAACLDVLQTADPREKASLGLAVAKSWQERTIKTESGTLPLPDRPARPVAPKLLAPRDMPRRRLGSPEGRIALLHSLAHIELNAIDLAFDMIARFLPECERLTLSGVDFAKDWLRVGHEECNHFNLLADRLEALGSHYGALPAHDGLWEAAFVTRNDWLARLAVVPLVLEARGLDVSPQTIEKLKAIGDPQSSNILSLIYREEIGHVSIGAKWFKAACQAQKTAPEETFQSLVRTYFKGTLKPPFNDEARSQAGFLPNFYRPLAN